MGGMMMPPKTINKPKMYFCTSDGEKIPMDEIKTIEPPIFEDSDIVVGKMFSDKTLSFSGKVVITTKNDRSYKSRRYRKNRKGYRGLCDLLTMTN